MGWYTKLLFHHVTPEQLRKDMIEYEDVYTAVVELYYQDYQNYDADVIHYDKPSGTEISCREQEACEQHRIPLNDTDRSNIEIVRNTYQGLQHNYQWDGVTVSDNFVTFTSEYRMQSIVYSIDGTKPVYVNGPPYNHSRETEGVDKITHHWYFIYSDWGMIG